MAWLMGHVLPSLQHPKGIMLLDCSVQGVGGENLCSVRLGRDEVLLFIIWLRTRRRLRRLFGKTGAL